MLTTHLSHTAVNTEHDLLANAPHAQAPIPAHPKKAHALPLTLPTRPRSAATVSGTPRTRCCCARPHSCFPPRLLAWHKLDMHAWLACVRWPRCVALMIASLPPRKSQTCKPNRAAHRRWRLIVARRSASTALTTNSHRPCRLSTPVHKIPPPVPVHDVTAADPVHCAGCQIAGIPISASQIAASCPWRVGWH